MFHHQGKSGTKPGRGIGYSEKVIQLDKARIAGKSRRPWDPFRIVSNRRFETNLHYLVQEYNRLTSRRDRVEETFSDIFVLKHGASRPLDQATLRTKRLRKAGK